MEIQIKYKLDDTMAIQDPQESLSLQKFMIDMVYYLNEVELKYLTLNLRSASRLNPVPEELRGWNWHLPPLKPYDVKLPMSLTQARRTSF